MKIRRHRVRRADNSADKSSRKEELRGTVDSAFEARFVPRISQSSQKYISLIDDAPDRGFKVRILAAPLAFQFFDVTRSASFFTQRCTTATLQVLGGNGEESGIIAEVTQPPIASVTQEPPDFVCFMIMVNHKWAGHDLVLLADRTLISLLIAKSTVLGERKSISAFDRSLIARVAEPTAQVRYVAKAFW